MALYEFLILFIFSKGVCSLCIHYYLMLVSRFFGLSVSVLYLQRYITSQKVAGKTHVLVQGGAFLTTSLDFLSVSLIRNAPSINIFVNENGYFCHETTLNVSKTRFGQSNIYNFSKYLIIQKQNLHQ